LVQEVGLRARERAAAFTWDRTIDDYERLFQGLVLARELRARLANGPVHDGAVPQLVASHIQEGWAANGAEVHLCDDYGETRAAGVAQSAVWKGSPDALQAVGARACATRESVVVDLGTGVGAQGPDYLLGVPLLREHGLRSFGALVARRAHPFGHRDREALALLARHLAPSLDSWRSSERMISWPDESAPGLARQVLTAG
jgi:hypothetical protein